MHSKYFHYLFVICFIILNSCSSSNTSIPEYLIGEFQDDYKISYQLSEDIFTQKPNITYRIISWNVEEQYFIAQNDSVNAFDPNLYTRVDWMEFENMNPIKWGFCLSAYNAPTADSAKTVQTADRANPKTGCNGYPFSRMKPITK